MAPRPGDSKTFHDSGPATSSHQETEYNVLRRDEVERHLPDSLLLKMDDSTNADEVLAEVRQWKVIADELLSAGMPLFGGYRNTSFSDDLRSKALKLDVFLDKLLDSVDSHSMERDQVYESLRFLIAQGVPFDEFKEKMSELDFSLKCNAIWENEAVAYRCNTCALTPCMSLCSDCFQNGNHEGHDFSRFFSREGGACDCGNGDVMRSTGFCRRHGSEALRPPPLSPLIVSLPQFIIVKLFIRLFAGFRGWKQFYDRDFSVMERTLVRHNEVKLVHFSELRMRKRRKLILFLQDIVTIGGPLRDALTKILLDEALYDALTKRTSTDDLAESHRGDVDISLDWRTGNKLREDIESLWGNEARIRKAYAMAADYAKIARGESPTSFSPSSYDSPKYCQGDEIRQPRSLLDELLFWIIRLCFPQNLINFSLSFLSDLEYRDKFAVRFFSTYPCIGELMLDICRDRNVNSMTPIGSRIIHISVQMLSSEILCNRLQEEIRLSEIILTTMFCLLMDDVIPLRHSLLPIYRDLSQQQASALNTQNFQHVTVLDCERNNVISNHGYWFVMSDVQNLFSHDVMAVKIVTDCGDFRRSCYVRLISHMQGMNLHWRIARGSHRENDSSEPFQRAFTLEFETSAICMFNMVCAIRGDVERSLPISERGHPEAAIAFFTALRDELKCWIQQIGVQSTTLSCPAMNVTFHLPLHRHLSTALSHFHEMRGFEVATADFRRDEALLRAFILHPLRIQAVRAEYQASMWVRNGTAIRVQAVLYTQQHLNNAFIIPDVDLIRYCGANVDPEWFIESVLESFHCEELFPRMNVELAEQQQPKIENMELDAASSSSSSTEGADFEMIDVQQQRKDSVESSMDEGSSQLPSPFKKLPRVWAWVEDEEGILQRIVDRAEWIDFMLLGVVKILSEVVYLRSNVGATLEESLREEVVAALSADDLTHSRLRGNITEKGSHGGEAIEATIDKILEEVAEFRSADEDGEMREGSYRLTKKAWMEQFCPVTCHLRAMSPKYTNAIFGLLEKIEREETGVRGRVWVAYLLTNFDPSQRHTTVREIPRVLLSEGFIEFANLVMHIYMTTSHVRDLTLQLVIYVLSLAVCYAKRLKPDERERKLKLFSVSRPFEKGKHGSVMDALISLFIRFLPESELPTEDAAVAEYLRKFIGQDLAQLTRISGGGSAYIARLLSLLYSSCPIARERLDAFLAERETVREPSAAPESLQEAAEAKKADEKRLVMKRRMEALLANQQKKHAERMLRMMDREGLSQQEMDAMDTTKQASVREYTCPICGETAPSSIDRPFGLLVRIAHNPLVEQQVSVEDSSRSLLEMDDAKEGGGVRKNVAHFSAVRRRAFFAHSLAPATWTQDVDVDLRTCGHHAHLACFDAYRETLQPSELQITRMRIELLCPVCRFPVNGQIPIALEHGREASQRGNLEHHPDFAFKVLRECTHQTRELEQSMQKKAYMDLEKTLKSQSRRWRTRTDTPEGQALPIALIKGNVERNVIYAQLAMPERRKNTRSLVTEHLLVGITGRPLFGERDSAILDLTINELMQPHQAPSPRREEMEEEVSEEEPPMKPVPSDEEILASTASLPPIPLPPPRSHWGADLSPISPPAYVEPILLFDAKAVLIMLSAYIVHNDTLVKENQMQLLRLVLRRVLSLHLTRVALQSLLRMTPFQVAEIATMEEPEEEANGTSVAHAFRIAAKCLQAPLHAEPLADLAPTSANEKSVIPALNMALDCVEDFARFATQFWAEIRVKELPGEGDWQAVAKPGLDELLEHLLGARTLELVPDIDIESWVLQTLPVVVYPDVHMSLSLEPLRFRPFGLLDLPHCYEDIFSRYFGRPCVSCGHAPSNPLICLLCSQLVCLDACCNNRISEHQPHTEVECHSWMCGGAIAPYISVTSSLVVFVREGSAAIWGSFYLDSHGEEDRNLRRGKPLFLSKRRAECLKRDWIDQDFERSSATWFPVDQLMQNIRESHLYR